MQHVNFHLKQKSTYHNSLHFFSWKFFLFTNFHLQQSSSFHSSVKGNAAREFLFETKIHVSQFPSLLYLKILLIQKILFSTIFFISFFSQGKCSTWIFIWNKTHHNSLYFFTWKFFLFKRFYFQQSSSFHSSVKGNAAREFLFEIKIHLPQFPSLFRLKIIIYI